MNCVVLSLQVIIQHLMFGRRIDAATDSPRIHHQLVPNVLQVESGITEVRTRKMYSLRSNRSEVNMNFK